VSRTSATTIHDTTLSPTVTSARSTQSRGLTTSHHMAPGDNRRVAPNTAAENGPLTPSASSNALSSARPATTSANVTCGEGTPRAGCGTSTTGSGPLSRTAVMRSASIARARNQRSRTPSRRSRLRPGRIDADHGTRRECRVTTGARPSARTSAQRELPSHRLAWSAQPSTCPPQGSGATRGALLRGRR